MTDSFRACAVVPTYDNPITLGPVVAALSEHLPQIVIVDDGSHRPGREASEGLAGARIRVVRHERNRGKGAAVRSGFREALRLGFSHALQIDADGQHDVADVPRFLAAARRQPDALILGHPVFDETQPWARSFGRRISCFWVDAEVGGDRIADPQCGFRVYPVAAALAARARGDRMEFDQELPVRMVWRGTPVVNLPTRVRYLSQEEGGVSHFRMLRDNLRISWLHTRLFTRALWRRVAV